MPIHYFSSEPFVKMPPKRSVVRTGFTQLRDLNSKTMNNELSDLDQRYTKLRKAHMEISFS